MGKISFGIDKKLATKILGLMCAIMLLTSFAPKLFPLGLLAIMGYLTWITRYETEEETEETPHH